MKKHFYYFVLILLFAGLTEKSTAQTIPNPSFENWTGQNPDGWQTLNAFAAGTTRETSNAHAGTKACFDSTINNFGTLYAPFTGTGNYYSVGRPDALHFWYIFNNGGNDTLKATFSLSNGVDTLGSGLFANSISTTVYKEGILNINYKALGNSDSMTIIFFLNHYNTKLGPLVIANNANTYFIIDDLSFGAVTTGIDNPIHPANIGLEQNCPNPTINETSIIYTISSTTPVTLYIFDVMGRKVKTVVNETQSPGRYKAIVDVQNLPAGNYFYSLNAGGNVQSNMLTVAK